MKSRSRFWSLLFINVPELSPMDRRNKLISGLPLQILDARTNWEWRAIRIKTSIKAPITSLKDRLKNLCLYPYRLTVAICLTAHRIISAVRVFREAGLKATCRLEGGMRAWWKAGLPVVKGTAPPYGMS